MTKQTNNNVPHLQKLKGQLKLLQQLKYRGALIRTKLHNTTKETHTKQYLAVERIYITISTIVDI